MTTEPNAVKTVFLGALEKDSRAERAVYLDEACAGNAGLRQRVEALLQAHDKPDQLLDQPAAEHIAAQNGSIPLDFLEPCDKPGVLGRLGHYEVLEVVGQGGMGVVVRAFDEKLHRVVAIKALAPVLANHPEARARFVREARATAAVTHDNVISIHAVEDSGPIPYLVMQFVDGFTLQDKIDRSGALALKEILRIGLQTAEGLAAAHRQGLIHRDIKPANILLENGVERVKITDFGLARSLRDNSLTKSGIIAGTPAYMSPEQANGEHVDQRSDLFSLGSVLYTLCAGHAPFRADTAMAVLKRVCEETPRPVREINPAIPEWLEALVAKLQAKNPADRFASADEVAEVLGRCLAKLQVDGSCGEISSVLLNRLRPRRAARKRWLVVAGLVAALAVASAGWLIYKSEFATDNTANANGTPEPQTPPPPPPDPVPTKPVVLKPSRTLPQHTKGVRTLAFSRDGTVMASGGLDRNIYLWDTKTWQVRGPLAGHPGDVSSLAFSPDGTRLASVTSSRDTCLVRIWNVATGKPATTFGKASLGLWDVAYSPDGQTIACGGSDKELRLLDAANGDERLVIRKVATIHLRRLSFSRDGRRIATGGSGPAHVWDTTTGEEIATRVGLPEGMGPSFLPDDTGLAGWNYGDGRITICDWPSGQVRNSWRAHPGTIEDLAVSPDGRFLASLGGDGGVRVWSTADFNEVATLIGHKGPVYAVAFTPDGSQLATGGRDDLAIRIWDLPAICRVRK